MKTSLNTRPSPIAGTWYPGNPAQLAGMIDTYLRQAEIPVLDGEVTALVAPHAGYQYSGRTAGYAFRTVQNLTVDVVAVVSPFHDYHPAPFLTTAHSAYGTPLGEVHVNRELITALDEILQNNCGAGLFPLAHDQEHALEIELPFLQRTLAEGFSLLPVMVQLLSPALAHCLGSALASVLAGKRALLVASTDLSHFYRETDANVLDGEMLNQIGAFSPEGVLEAEETGSGSACGAYAVAAVLWAAQQMGANSVKILHHSTSADETGDRSRVVGYGAAAILRRA
ncbi:MAG: AmmeMemoRadiSam system protein B [Anaerolineaceae bacterium]|nr:AmmeMemoRadiSam system protein B [Anaerolineaceae bacterium]